MKHKTLKLLNMHNEQPFYIGQKVVALSEAYLFVKGKVYTVGECFVVLCGHMAYNCLLKAMLVSVYFIVLTV
jgi:hypothetical protein